MSAKWSVAETAKFLGIGAQAVRRLDSVLLPEIISTGRGNLKRFYDPTIVLEVKRQRLVAAKARAVAADLKLLDYMKKRHARMARHRSEDGE